MPRDVRRAKEPTRSQLTVKPLAVFTFAFVRDDYLRTMIHVLYTYTYCTRTLGSTTRTLGSTTRTLGSRKYFRTFVLSYFRTKVLSKIQYTYNVVLSYVYFIYFVRNISGNMIEITTYLLRKYFRTSVVVVVVHFRKYTLRTCTVKQLIILSTIQGLQ